VIILMNYGEEHRSYRETNIHEHSSRSHTLFQVYIESKRKDQSDGKVRYSVLNLVDLAGSERLNEFEVRQHNQMEETGHINKSLFVLSNVVNKLAEGKRNAHIPYRDSKLTRILSNALGGNSLSTVICTVSPAAMNYNLTLSTLRFAVRAKSLKNRPQINELMSEDAAINQFKA
jgi:centromeric protein E